MTSIAPLTDRRQPLDPAAFTLVGFGEHREALEATVRQLAVRSGEPAITTVENAVFAPAGGIFDDGGEALELERRHGSSQEAPQPERELDEEVLYLGLLFGHYGHFLLESLARIWAIAAVDPSVRVVFHPATVRLAEGRPAPRVSWMWRMLEAFGVPYERLLILERPTRIRRLLVPEPLHELGVFSHERAAEPFRALAARVLECGGAGVADQPVYLSRRLLPSAQRQTVGEAELENVLQENGVLVAHPQAMTLADQVRLFNRHADILATDGTAAWGMLFALGAPRMHLLTSPAPFPDLFLISAVAGAPASFVHCLGDGGRPVPLGSGRLFPQLLDFDPLLAYLTERGFLRGRQRAALVRRTPQMHEQHDEAWLYKRVRQAANLSRKSAPNWWDGATLTDAEEREATALAGTSWPLSIVLAWYHLVRDVDAPPVGGLLLRFAQLSAAEADAERLARNAADVALIARDVRRRRCDLSDQLDAVIAERFPARERA
jgi:Glycosyltransferase 61